MPDINRNRRVVLSGAPFLFDPVAEFGADLRFYNKVRGEVGESGDNTISRLINDQKNNGLLDFRNNYAHTSTVYQSNFTLSTDGWVISSGFTSIAFNQTINGSGGWLKLVCNNAAANNRLLRTFSLAATGSIKMKMKLFLPITNTTIKSMIFLAISRAGRLTWTNLGYGIEYNLERNMYTSDWNTSLNLYGSINGNLYNDLNGDVIYIKDIIMTKRDGTPMPQGVTADMGTYQPTTKDVLLDGISDNFDCFNNWADIKNDTKGSVHFHFNDLEGAGNANIAIWMQRISGNDWFQFGLTAGDKLAFSIKAVGVTVSGASTATVVRGGNITIGFWNDGVTSKMWVNGVSIAHTWGGTKFWFNDLALIETGKLFLNFGLYNNARYKGQIWTGGNDVSDTQAMKIHNLLKA